MTGSPIACVRRSRSRLAAHGLTVALTLATVLVHGPAGLLAQPAARLKTPAPNRAAIAPLEDAVFGFDDQARRGKPPADAAARIERMQAAAGPAKAEIRAFLTRLRSNGETQAFDEAVAAEAARSAPALVAELRAAGGASAALGRADQYIDEMISARRQHVSHAWLHQIEDVLGVARVEAAGGTCAFFWWVISAGYGTAHAYRSCYY
jgi:hypothetical protein